MVEQACQEFVGRPYTDAVRRQMRDKIEALVTRLCLESTLSPIWCEAEERYLNWSEVEVALAEHPFRPGEVNMVVGRKVDA